MFWLKKLLTIENTVRPKTCAQDKCCFVCSFVILLWSILPIAFVVASLALGQYFECPSVSPATFKNMGKYIPRIYNNWWHMYEHNESKPSAHFIKCTDPSGHDEFPKIIYTSNVQSMGNP